MKVFIYALLAYGTYYAFTLYILYTISQTAVSECGFNHAEIDDLKARKASNLEIEMFMHKRFSCLKAKQNSIQTFVFPVPENWINPPPNSITYKDIPSS